MYEQLLNESIDEAVNQRMDDTGNITNLNPFDPVPQLSDDDINIVGEFHGDLMNKFATAPLRMELRKAIYDEIKSLENDGHAVQPDFQLTEQDIDDLLEDF